jgi:DNA-binding GntR family transcriptional regulator
VSIDTSDLSEFTAYEDVTESVAIEWAKEALGEEEVARLEADVADQIEASKTPTHGTGIPWE